ncbi:MAG TPA: hypothetical protein VFY39_12130 [Gammaproteobacteria bacterium]|nr:hypothetical protein [Gammaproteobacteria bacterium]
MSSNGADTNGINKYAQVGEGQPQPSKKMERRLLFAVLGAPIAWALHEVVDFSVIGRRCEIQGGLVVWQWGAVIGVGVLAFAIAALAAITAFRLFHRWPREAALLKAEGWNRVSFMALLGFFLSVILMVNIIYFGLTPWVVHPCMSDAALSK